MTQRPNDWDNVKPAPFGTQKLEPGGYILKVIHAGDIITPVKKHEAIKIYFDIAQGECTDFFKKLSESLKRDISLNYLQQTKEEKSLPFFKRLVQFFEESNPGYVWDFRPMSLVGKIIGGVLGEREYYNEADDKIKVINDISYFCPISTIIEGGYNIPKKKKIDSTFPPKEKKPEADYSSLYK